jgi:hypothetical protein
MKWRLICRSNDLNSGSSATATEDKSLEVGCLDSESGTDKVPMKCGYQLSQNANTPNPSTLEKK